MIILAAGLLTATPPAPAVEVSAHTVADLYNWYYATTFGTGVYIVGESSVTVLAIPFSYTLREPNFEHWGLSLTIPTSVALGNFDLYDPNLGAVSDIQLSAWSALPGIEALIALSPSWQITPFANYGWGKESETQATATVYQAGISTMYEVRSIRYPEIEIGGKYVYAGYRTSDNYSTPVTLMSFGISTVFPTSWRLGNGRQVNIGAHWIDTYYVNDISFRLPEPGFTDIQKEQELGFTFGLRPGVIFLDTTFDRIGLGYVVSSDGLRGIRLVTGFDF